MNDARVEAIRKDPVVGRGSCMSIDECFDDKDLVEVLDKAKITIPLEAVRWARESEGMFKEQELNSRWGEDSDPQLVTWKLWKQALKENPL